MGKNKYLHFTIILIDCLSSDINLKKGVKYIKDKYKTELEL